MTTVSRRVTRRRASIRVAGDALRIAHHRRRSARRVGGARGVRDGCFATSCRRLPAHRHARSSACWLARDFYAQSRRHGGRDRLRRCVIGGVRGLATGILLGANRFLSRRLRSAHLLPRTDAEDHLLSGDDHVVRRRRGLEDRDGRALVLLSDRDQRGVGHARDRPRADPRRPELSRVDVADGDQDLSARDARSRSSTACGSGLGVAVIGTLLAGDQAVEPRHRLPHHPGRTRRSTCRACTRC